MFSRLLAGFLLLISLLSLFPDRHWLQELLSNFTPHFAILSLVLLPLAYYSFKKFRVGFSLICLLTFFIASTAFLMPVARFLVSVKSETLPLNEKGSVKVVYLEIFKESGPINLCSVTADIILLSAPKSFLEIVQCDELYRLTREIDGGRKLALYSRHPATLRTDNLGDDLSPGLILADLHLKGEDLAVVLFNLPPVFSEETYRRNRIFLRRLSSLFRHDKGDVFIAANPGASAFSSNFHIFRLAARLQATTRISGQIRNPGCPYPLLNCVHFFSAGRIILRSSPINITGNKGVTSARGAEVIFFD